MLKVYEPHLAVQHDTLELRARMQGKSCFNFKALDPALLKELQRLTRHSFEKRKGML